MIRVEHDEQGNVVVHGEAVVHEAERLRDGLLAALETGCKEYSLNLSHVTALDCAGVQLLLAFRRAANGITVHSCPASIRQFLERTGLAPHLL